MRLEELIVQALSEDGHIAAGLAVYENKPAVFYRTAPDDASQGWQESIRYPRIVFHLERQANQEQKSAGSVRMSLVCKGKETVPEEIEQRVRACMEDLLICPEQTSSYCFSWERTADLVKASGDSSELWGMEMTFDLFACQGQEAADPDPVSALKRYIKESIPQAFVLGLDQTKDYKRTAAGAAVLYCRLDSLEKGQETNTIVWMDAKISIYILCTSEAGRQKWSMELANALALREEMALPDQSPMKIKALQVNKKADHLKEGQLMVTGHYGLLRDRNQPHRITEIHMGL